MDRTSVGKKIMLLSVFAAMILAGTMLIVSEISDDSSAASVELPKGDMSGDGFTWSYSAHTLTLENLEYSGSETPFVFPDTSAVSVIVSGYNVITVTGTDDSFGIKDSGADVVFSGDGYLEINVNSSVSAYGIVCDTLTVNGDPTLKIDCIGVNSSYGIVSNGVTTVGAHTITIESVGTTSYGITTDSLKMNDSDITIYSHGTNSYGVNVLGNISMSSSFLDSIGDVYGVYAEGTITLSDSSTIGASTTAIVSYGITAKSIVSNQGYLAAKGTEYAFSVTESITAEDADVINANEVCLLEIPKKLTQMDPTKDVVISNTEASQLSFDKDTIKLRVGNSNTLTVVYKSESLVEHGVTWSSSSDSIATVDQNGNVTGTGAGVVTITATSNLDPSQTAKCLVTVGTATGTEPIELWIAIVGAIIGCLAILGVTIFINKKLK